MRYLLFDWGEVSEDIIDPTELTDQEFEELCKLNNGHIIEDSEEFASVYNSQQVSTATHQLRIIDNITPKLEEINRLVSENEIGAWESDLKSTVTAVILEDFQEVHDESDLEERGDDGVVKYNGWGDRLLNLISKPK